MTAHRKNGTGTARPVLSLGTRKPRAAAPAGSTTADSTGGARTAPTIKIKRAARAQSTSEGHAERPVRRLATVAGSPAAAPQALRKRRPAPLTLKKAKAPAPKAKPVKPPRPTPPVAGPDEPLAAPELSERQRRHLRGLAHALKPLVRLGSAGLTPAVAKETARALLDHELIKVKAQAADRAGRDALLEELARLTGSALVHRIGHMGVLYRPRPGLPKILIPG